MIEQKIAFVGGGNMARSLIGGLIRDGYPAGLIKVADPQPEARDQVRELGVESVFAASAEAAGDADIVVLAVKPQVMCTVARELHNALGDTSALFLSIAAGLRTDDMLRWLGGKAAIVRSMPNTPALLGCGAAGLYGNRYATDEQRNSAEAILRAVGTVVWVDDEDQLDAITAVSGSGPAYFFLLMEIIEVAAVEMGLSEAAARLLTQETALGAARMALESSDSVAVLRRQVTSPGGTTAAALDELETGGLRTIVRAAVRAAQQRSRELARQFGEEAKYQ